MNLLHNKIKLYLNFNNSHIIFISFLLIFVLFPFFFVPLFQAQNGLSLRVLDPRGGADFQIFNRIEPIIRKLDSKDLSALQAYKRYSLEFKGYLFIPEDGSYRFYVYNKGVTQLDIDETVLFNEDRKYRGRSNGSTIVLEKGYHPFLMVVTKHCRDPGFMAWWKPENGSEGRIPQKYLFPDYQSVKRSLIWNDWKYHLLYKLFSIVWFILFIHWIKNEKKREIKPDLYTVNEITEKALNPEPSTSSLLNKFMHKCSRFDGLKYFLSGLLCIYIACCEFVWFNGGFTWHIGHLEFSFYNIREFVFLSCIVFLALVFGMIVHKGILHNVGQLLHSDTSKNSCIRFVCIFLGTLFLITGISVYPKNQRGITWELTNTIDGREFRILYLKENKYYVDPLLKNFFSYQSISVQIRGFLKLPESMYYKIKSNIDSDSSINVGENLLHNSETPWYRSLSSAIPFSLTFHGWPDLKDKEPLFEVLVKNSDNSSVTSFDGAIFPDLNSLETAHMSGVKKSGSYILFIIGFCLCFVWAFWDRANNQSWKNSVYTLAFVFVMMLALFPRFYLLTLDYWRLNSDNAVNGIMAKDILYNRGHPVSYSPENDDYPLPGNPVFFYGQEYHGSLSPHIMALVYSLTKNLLFSMKVVPLLFYSLFLIMLMLFVRVISNRTVSILVGP